MSSKIIRLFGFVLILSAAVVAVLNLKRVANLSLPWLSPLLLVFGAALVTLSRRTGR